MKRKSYSELDPEIIIADNRALYRVHREDFIPPYSNKDLKKIDMFSYLFFKFLQENNLTTRKILETFEDTHKIVLRVKDLTPEGFEFYRNAQRFLDLTNFNVNPENRVKKILVKDLQKMRSI